MVKIKVLEEFILHQKSFDKSDATIKSYRSDITKFATWFKETNSDAMSFRKITPTDLRQYKRFLISSDRKPSTINRHLISIKVFLEWGWQVKQIKYRFPMPKPVRQNKIAPQWLGKTEQNSLLRYIECHAGNRDIAIIKILLNTGARVNELCQLKWTSVLLSERKGNMTVNYGKGNKCRDIPLNKDARNAFLLLGYKEHTEKDGYVFTGQRGPLTPRGIQLIFRRLFNQSNFATLTPHKLRHTFCKNLINADVSLEKVAALAGHENLNTTKTYCKPSLSDLSEAVELIGEEE
jgi:integrase/recombinase XerC